MFSVELQRKTKQEEEEEKVPNFLLKINGRTADVSRSTTQLGSEEDYVIRNLLTVGPFVADPNSCQNHDLLLLAHFPLSSSSLGDRQEKALALFF
jgi:hypothetical protein